MQNLKNKLVNYFSERFGVDGEFWNDFKVYKKSGDLWICSEDVRIRESFVAGGIRALRLWDSRVKPTTYILQFLEDQINKNIVKLDSKDLERLVFKRKKLDSNLSPGYVAMEFRGKIIGCGLIDSNGLHTQIPKGRARELEGI